MVAQFKQLQPMRNSILLRPVEARVVLIRGSDDNVYHIGETTTAFSTLFHSVIQLYRDNQLPAIFIQHRIDRLDDLFFSNNITVARNHFIQPQSEAKLRDKQHGAASRVSFTMD
tara:strand:+ start:450 stop:791 length:342 start_codon:yes stop_codon:yes gene_type:complete